MEHRRAWTIPAVLIRLGSIIEEDLEAAGEQRRLGYTPIPSASDHNEGRDQ